MVGPGDATIGGNRVHQIRCLCACDLPRVERRTGAAGAAAARSRRGARSCHAAPTDRKNPAREWLPAAGNAGAKRRGLSGPRHRPARPPGTRRDRRALRRHSDGAPDHHGAARRYWPTALWSAAGVLRRRPADRRGRCLSAAGRAYRYLGPGAPADPAAEAGCEARGGHARAGSAA